MEPSVRTFTLLLLMFLPMHSNGYPSGLVQPACTSMVPQHGVPAQTSSPPYNLSLSKVTHEGKSVYEVTLIKGHDGSDFRGFMIQAREPGGNTPLGTFVVSSTNGLAQTLNCTASEDTVSHTSRVLKPKVSVIWIPPKEAMTDIKFRATVVEVRNTFWTGLESNTFRASGGTQLLASALSQLLLCGTVLIYTQFTI